ncbi:TetR/AcrR family transcriptional regulator [Desulfocurvus sp. DL9XJH121]
MPHRTVIPFSEPEDVRRRILDALQDVLARGGPRRVTAQAVAARAGVDESLITRLFGGLAHLQDAFVQSDRFWPPVAELAGGDVQELRQRPLGEQLSTFFLNYLRGLRARPWTLAVLAEEGREDGLLGHALVYVRERRALEFFEEVITTDPPPDVDLSAVVLIMALAVNQAAVLSRRVLSVGGVDLETDQGWERIEATIQRILYRTMAL